MLRKDQLSNVAFGGAWSERIAGDEALKSAMLLLEQRLDDTIEEDLRQDGQLAEALELVAAANPKGAELSLSFRRALDRPDGTARLVELRRVTRLMRGWLGARAQ